MIELPKAGYTSKKLFSDISLGAVDGAPGGLWCYAFASILFAGPLAVFVPTGAVFIMIGWILISLYVTIFSRAPVHVAVVDEQGVVILGSIGILLSASLGEQAAGASGLATMLAAAMMASLGVALVMYLVARFHLSRLLELLPYPVICGFMAGIGWLLLDAGVSLALGVSISPELFSLLQQGDAALRLLLPLAAGAVLIAVMLTINASWVLPAVSGFIVMAFYVATWAFSLDLDSLRDQGWLFNFPSQQGGALEPFKSLSLSDVDFAFLATVAPQLLTIVFLTLLSASKNLTTLIATNPREQLDGSSELKTLSRGNLLCALVGSPPGYSDAVASTMYRDYGASSRWMQFSSTAVVAAILLFGSTFVAYIPIVLLCATIFMFSAHLFMTWMYENVRSFTLLDYSIVCIILLTVILFGFMPGIVVGVMLTVLLFVLRYSMINAVQRQYTLSDQRSSVERSANDVLCLNQYGRESITYCLQGFLFFGTANSVRDIVRQAITSGQYRTVLLDLRRVTGMDVSALNTLAQVYQLAEAEDVKLLYANVSQETREALVALKAVAWYEGRALVFDTEDYALEYIEELILQRHAGSAADKDVLQLLTAVLGDDSGAQVLAQAMTRLEVAPGEALFSQGDADNGLYLLESGSLTASVESGGTARRVKKFSAGSIIGEMSAYADEKSRSASVIADQQSVLYQLDHHAVAGNLQVLAVVHELVARTLGSRVDYMNRRLLLEIS